VIKKLFNKRLIKTSNYIPYLLLIPIIIIFYTILHAPIPGFDVYKEVFILLFSISLVALFCIPLTKNLTSYYIIQAVILISSILSIYMVRGNHVIQLLILLIITLEIISYEPFPNNIIGSLSFTVVIGIINFTSLIKSEASRIGLLQFVSLFFIPGCIVAIVGSLMFRYREITVQLQQERDRLSESIVNLTKSNSEYLDYAMIAQEKGTESERRRITRDIHDIVGYTLTNNIMLMEAALDLMKENPLALPKIITTSRENAQDGLDQVRKAMYKLREKEHDYPIGLNAILRLGNIFQQATGITVNINFSNMPLTISDQIDSTIYHLIQEAYVNAFRHGHATEIILTFWYDEKQVKVYILDNGIGSMNIKEGIGIQGMRERLSKLDGDLEIGNTIDGFQVRVTIPI
jgi:signal transduction histidine kinase